jgi:hypothetical protein
LIATLLLTSGAEAEVPGSEPARVFQAAVASYQKS